MRADATAYVECVRGIIPGDRTKHTFLKKACEVFHRTACKGECHKLEPDGTTGQNASHQKCGNRSHTVNGAKGSYYRGGVIDPFARENDVPYPLYHKTEDAAKKEHPKQLLISAENALSKCLFFLHTSPKIIAF